MARKSTQQRLLYCFVAAIVIGVIIATALAYLRSHTGQLTALKSLDTWQQADVPLGYPLKDKSIAVFDPRFLQLSAIERALIPAALTMTQPMGSNHGALTYNAQPFWAKNTHRGGHHTGDDINGIGGMNTDLGDPVFAVANGLVIYCGEPSNGWGKTVILAHRSEDGSVHQLIYSHLQKRIVTRGELMTAGEKIGSVGTANFNYPAHLHLELKNSTGVWIGPGYVNSPTEHLNPATKTTQFSRKPPELLCNQPLLIIKRESLKQARESILIDNVKK